MPEQEPKVQRILLTNTTDQPVKVDLQIHGALHWSKQAPTAPGWYWWRGVAAYPAEIFKLRPDGRVSNRCGDSQWTPEQFGGEWAGPIPEPEEVASE